MNSEIIGMCIEVVMVRHTRSILRSICQHLWAYMEEKLQQP